MKYVFDIDGTICSNTNGRYTESEPYFDMISYINKLYSEGNYIVYHTARGMGLFDNDQLQAINEWHSFTESQLKEWNAKYHLLLLGKPSGDIYIDDKGIKDDDFFK